MELIKKFFSDKGRVGVAIVCLLMMSVLVVSAITGETLAADTSGGDVSTEATSACYQCNSNSNLYKWKIGTSSDSDCAAGYHIMPEYKTQTSCLAQNKACYQCNSNSNILKWETSSSADVVCPAGYHENTSIEEATCKTYKITYNANGGSGGPTITYKSHGNEVKLSTNEPTRTGYVFRGWAKTDGGVVSLKAGASYYLNEDLELFAVWTENSSSGEEGGGEGETITYSVSYKNNGGTGTMSNSTYTKGVSQALRKNTFTRTGYAFNGWNTKADGTGNKYTDGQSISISSDLTLYAQWKINKVNIKYNTNGGTIKEANGYSAKDGIIYSGNEFFIHTINYGTTTSSDGLSDYNNPDFINITRNGYSVPIDAEWICLSGDCTVGKTYDQSKQYNHSDFCDASKGDCNVVLGVNWKANKVNIKYNTNGGTIKEANGYSAKDGIIYNGNDVFMHTIDYGKSTSSDGLSDYNNPNFINIARNGYSALTGAEWLCISGCATSGKTFSQSKQYNHSDFCDASKGDCNVVLGVNWQVNKYTVKYNANGGTGTMNDSIYTYGVSKTLTANSFTRTDYTFKCWNTKSDGSGINYTDKQNITITEDLTLYAQWNYNDSTGGEDEIVIKYYISYDKNGGTGTMSNSEHQYGYASGLSKNIYTRTGYTFNGWNTKADGTGTTYTDGQTISNLASSNGEVVTLYAQWLEEVNDDDDGNPSTPGTDNDYSGNDSNQENDKNDNLDNGPVTGSLATILVSLIGIGALGGTIYYRKKFKN